MKEQTASATRRLQSFAGEFDRLTTLTMAAGEDFNDELMFILNYAEVSLDLLGPEHPACEGMVEVTHAAMRCAETTRCLLLLTQRARESVLPHCGMVITMAVEYFDVLIMGAGLSGIDADAELRQVQARIDGLTRAAAAPGYRNCILYSSPPPEGPPPAGPKRLPL